jgi:PAS domain S-box-containing protein
MSDNVLRALSALDAEVADHRQAEAVLQQLADSHSRPAPGSFRELASALGIAPSDDSSESRLRRAEAKYRALVEQIPAVTFMAPLDGSTNELYVSPQIGELLGFSQQEWFDDPVLWYRQLHPDDKQHWEDRFSRTVISGEPFRADYRLIARDGRVVWVHGEVKVVTDDAGRPMFLQGVAFDITERKLAEATLERARDDLERRVQQRTAALDQTNRRLQAEIAARKRLEQELRLRVEQLAESDRHKDEFLAMLGHELRNPLASISGAVELLNIISSQNDDARQARGIVERQSQHMRRLVDDLLEVSRITRGKIQLRAQLLDLVELVQRTCHDFRATIADDGRSLELSLPPEPVWVAGDATRLAQIIVNLLDNAAKYSDRGGPITLALATDPASATAMLRVRDRGIGMAAGELTRIFEPFHQGEPNALRGQQGLGLGLALVKGLVELHGGRVWAASSGQGQGSEFTVVLPLAKPVEPVTVGPPIVASSTGKFKILVIDDSVDAAFPLQALLTLNGHQVETATSGAEGIETAHRFLPDLVLCDIGLPGGMDGYAVARALRANSATRRTCLAAVTGYGQDEHRRKALEVGFDQHFTKPVPWATLQSLIATLPLRSQP